MGAAPAIRVRLVSGVLWLLVAAGPVLGTAALLRPAVVLPAGDGAAEIPTGVEALAELTVLAHLSALPGGVGGWLAPGHPGMRAGPAALDGLTGDQQAAAARASARPVTGAAAVAVMPAGPGRWGVTVAVLRDGEAETWQVTVAAGDSGLAVETLPAPVGSPDNARPPLPGVGALRPPAADDVLAVAVQRFVSAYLTGDGDLPRYVAPQTDLPPPSWVARSAELRRIAAGPVDDRRVAVLAEVRVTRDDGAVHLVHYPLLLRPSQGRWEVQRLLPALPLDRP
ncbi:hypothetical protein BH23ACT9_BH23ACT9_27920 [soil metagenome]